MPHTSIVRRRGIRIALGAVGATVGVLALAQLLLPVLAADRVRSRTERYGKVMSVHVHAFPAIELLWGHAESIEVRAGELTMTPAQTTEMLWEARGIDSLEVTATAFHVGPLTLRGVALRKRGRAIYGQGEVRGADLRDLPGGMEVQPLESAGGQIRVRATGGVFGLRASVTAGVGPSEGKLVAQPEGVPFAEFARVTLFSDPRMAIESVGYRPTAEGADAARVWLTARLSG